MTDIERPPQRPNEPVPLRLLARVASAMAGRKNRVFALQGGGALGAFTAGVLDAFLDHDDRPITALSGASAGAINAAVLATGLAKGGRQGAREALHAFWQDVARGGAVAEALSLPSRLLGLKSRKPMRGSGDILRGLIEKHTDIDALKVPEAPRLFISATHVASGTGRIFSNDDLSHAALAASACLPLLQPAVVVDGEAYWDGGFTFNPPMRPLMTHGGNVVLVRLLTTAASALPSSVDEVEQHLRTFAFAAPLAQELASLGSAASRVQEIAFDDLATGEAMTALPTPSLVERRLRAGFDAGCAFLERENDRGQLAGESQRTAS